MYSVYVQEKVSLHFFFLILNLNLSFFLRVLVKRKKVSENFQKIEGEGNCTIKFLSVIIQICKDYSYEMLNQPCGKICVRVIYFFNVENYRVILFILLMYIDKFRYFE